MHISSLSSNFGFLKRRLNGSPVVASALSSLGDGKQPIKTWARSSTITSDLVGQTFLVPSTTRTVTFVPVTVTAAMVGSKLGDHTGSKPPRGLHAIGVKAAK